MNAIQFRTVQIAVWLLIEGELRLQVDETNGWLADGSIESDHPTAQVCRTRALTKIVEVLKLCIPITRRAGNT
jgi:hypothetical protein